MCRVLKHGGVLTGSAVLNDTGVRYEPIRRVGRAAHLLGPSCTGTEVEGWLSANDLTEVTLADQRGDRLLPRGQGVTPRLRSTSSRFHA